jgi:hypothetical protein
MELQIDKLSNLHPSPNYKGKCKSTGKVVPVLDKAPRHEDVLGSGGIAISILTSALDGGERLASLPGRFTHRERAPGTHWIGGWMGPRADLDPVVKKKILSPRRKSNPRTPIVQPVVQRYILTNSMEQSAS